jgi:hypothetical protein
VNEAFRKFQRRKAFNAGAADNLLDLVALTVDIPEHDFTGY